MGEVDYLKLSEQYASFLVAVGGVSITVLTLVLSFGSDTRPPTKVNSRSYLVAALIVATVSCFIGAHMMAETAAFIEFHKNTNPLPGDRLFLLATTNIFIAIILVLFALTLLPTTSRRVHAASIAWISGGIFLVIVVVALYWLTLAGYYRMSVPQNGRAIWVPILIGFLWGGLLWFFSKSKRYLRPMVIFAPSALSTVISLIWFAWIFKEGDATRLYGARMKDIWFFSFALTLSYAPLVVAVIKTMLEKQFADVES